MSDRIDVRPGVVLHNGDCLEVLKTLPDSSVDSIVTDPPAGINFMGKNWDKDKGGRNAWIAWMTLVAAECLRVLKPGGHALVWSLPRTSHWTATAWEDAGFEVRDRVAHIFGSGFPKSLDISKAIDKAAGEKREVIGKRKKGQSYRDSNNSFGRDKDRNGVHILTAPATAWNGWGTALKPAIEDWWLFRKPCEESTVAANVLKYGTGALNIDACRIPGEAFPVNRLEQWSGFGQIDKPEYDQEINSKGRWPANFIHDGSECVVDEFPRVATGGNSIKKSLNPNNVYGSENRKIGHVSIGYKEDGSAARFFYCAKPDQHERNFGVKGVAKDPASVTDFRRSLKEHPENWSNGTETPYTRTTPRKNNHPTVKAQSLMVWLIKLITPPGGVVLDAFLGSGSTGVAAVGLGCRFIGIDSDADYIDISTSRIISAQAPLFVEAI